MLLPKNVPLKWYFSIKKNLKDVDNYWPKKLTLKVINWHFSISWFRTYIDLPKKVVRWKGAIYYSLKLPFDVEVAEKFLNGI